MNNSPKVSIIIPVHNAEKYLEQSVGGVINQTLKDIEIICVDDASTDDSLRILNEYANRDSRVKVFHHDVSKSALGARKTGVLAAKGEYIMFLDADDYYSWDACELVYNKIKECDVDVLHFSLGIVNCSNISESRVAEIKEYTMPYSGSIYGKDVFNYCFESEKYAHTPVNKIYRADLCKEAYMETEDIHLIFAEDLYAYFIIASKAKSYYGWKSKDLYYYCYGRGVTSGNQNYSLERFEKLCRHSDTVKALKRYNVSHNVKADSIIEKYQYNWLNSCIGIWKNHISKVYAYDALKLMFKYWGVAEVTSMLCKRFWNQRTEIADKIGKFDITPIENRDIKTVAFYYYCYSVGGVERVLSLVMPLFVKMGYKVILVTDKQPGENDFVLPDGVERCVLFDKDEVNADNFMLRASSWEKVIKTHNIDVVMYNFWRSHLFLWDLLYLKGMDIPTILVSHGVFSLALSELHKNFAEHTKTFALADGMTVLSHVDKLFWETYVDRVYYMPNPVSEDLHKVNSCKWENNSIIWIGRASYEKNPQAPFEIMKKVVSAKPDAKLYLVGDFNDPHWQTVTNEYGLQENIIFTGFVPDVSKYIEKASVHLMTSNFEGFPMALVEAKAHSMPTVMFGMPHLMLGKKECGTIGVDMLDYDSAANEIIKFLNNKDYWNENSMLAKQSVEALMNFDFENAWKSILEGKKEAKFSDDLTERFVQTVVNHYDLGAKAALEKQKFINQRRSLMGKVKGGINCIKEKGLVYTVKLILKR